MGKFPIDVVLFAVLCGIIQCENNPVKSDVKPTQNRDIADYLDGPLRPVYEMIEFTLESVVQPQYLTDLEEDIDKEFVVPDDFLDSFEENWEEWTLYFLGFGILACVGVFLILCMPVVGATVACCRCCGNCGGRPRAMESKCSTCKRVCCGVTFFVVTSAITLGVVCMFAFNAEISQRLYVEEGNVWDELASHLKRVQTYLDDTVDEMDAKILDEYVDKKNRMINVLKDIPTDVVDVINNKTNVLEDLEELHLFTSNLTSLNTSLVRAGAIQEELDLSLFNLTDRIQQLKNETLLLLEDCFTAECNTTRNAATSLFIGMDTSAIQLDNATVLVQVGLDNNITQTVNASYEEFNQIVTIVNDTVLDEIEQVEGFADDIQAEIEKFINDTATNLDEIKIDAVEYLEDLKKDISEGVELAYWATVAFGIPLCVIVFCGFIGLFCGIVCPRPSPNAGCCSGDRTLGSDALLAGVGFTFIFYWMYAMVVLVVFLTGGVTHTEVCRHLVDYDVNESAGVLNVIDRMAVYQLNESFSVSISPFNAYTLCGENASFYRALDLENNGYNVSGIINTTEIREAIDQIKQVPIELPDIHIMNDSLKASLDLLGHELDSLNFTLYYGELDNNVTTVDLQYIVELLESTLESNNGTVDETEIEKLIHSYNETEYNLVGPAQVSALSLTTELRNAEDILPDTSLVHITTNLKQDENSINENGTTLISGFINSTADELYDQTVDFTNGMISTVEDDLGKCEPLYSALTGTIDSVCVKSLYPLNGFWYSLGWCLLFLIPSIIIAFILADEYRKAHPYMDGIETSFDDLGQSGYDAYAGVPDYWTFDNSSTSGVQMYQLPRVNLQTQTKGQPDPNLQGEGMAAFDNPIYSNDEEMKIPRPTVIPTPYYPPSTMQRKQQQRETESPSPPPSYRDAIDSDDRISYDDNYDTRM